MPTVCCFRILFILSHSGTVKTKILPFFRNYSLILSNRKPKFDYCFEMLKTLYLSLFDFVLVFF
jgi:hypothetical protein